MTVARSGISAGEGVWERWELSRTLSAGIGVGARRAVGPARDPASAVTGFGKGRNGELQQP